ncbi:hypothetical protein [Kineosporia sp. NBRC 101731]|uniref:hypothetical protein n=1 Tax=Kineosporia sp. NBRC 101731 TaxID=3032199 RepID=UPI0024A557C2|nr:hypothetical protein [Kineosporia sp. NBRC 101731]GLY33840.1 hypothetical protein Kisp02_72050 [Kineosporia sp. NBRC 101731]
MTVRHQPAATTHTVELDQVQEINRRLEARADVTAAMLGMEGAPAAVPSTFTVTLFGPGTPAVRPLGRTAVLRSVAAEGSPEFPYVLGHFSDGDDNPGRPSRVVELHSQALHQLCLRMGLSQCWGTDAVLHGSIIR